MTEGQTLFLTLTIVYLSNCSVWIGKDTILFSTRGRNRWTARFAEEYFGNANGSIAFLGLLPSRISFLGHYMPVSISPVGICASPLQEARCASRSSRKTEVLLYKVISDARAEGQYLWLNGSRFSRCHTPEQARSIAKLIDRCSREPEEQREESVRGFLALQFAKDRAVRRLALVEGLTAPIRWKCSAFFVFLFAIVPIAAILYGVTALIIPAGIVMLIGASFISIAYFRAHKLLYPSEPQVRSGKVVKAILSPLTAIRSADSLTLNALSPFHPLLLASLLLDSGFSAFARTVIRDLKYPIRRGLTDPQARAIMDWHAAWELEACTQFLEVENLITLEDLLAPPPWDGVSSAYCPRCSCQFATAADRCPDCQNVELIDFPAPRTSDTASVHLKCQD